MNPAVLAAILTMSLTCAPQENQGKFVAGVSDLVQWTSAMMVNGRRYESALQATFDYGIGRALRYYNCVYGDD